MRNQQKFSLHDRVKSFLPAFQGLRFLLRNEHNSRIHLIAAGIAIILAFILKVNWIEFAAISIVIGMVFITEILNTAVEKLCDKVEPNYDKQIKIIKDLGSAAVLIASLISIVVGSIVFLPKIIAICGL